MSSNNFKYIILLNTVFYEYIRNFKIKYNKLIFGIDNI